MEPESGALVQTLPGVLNLGPHERGGGEDFVQFPYHCIMPWLSPAGVDWLSGSHLVGWSDDTAERLNKETST